MIFELSRLQAAQWPAATSLSDRVAIDACRIQHDPVPRRVGIRHRNRRQQRPRVRMLRRREERRGRPHLDDLSQIHHGDAVADVLDQPQIVRDEQIGQRQPLLQIHQQVDDLRLHRHVERRHRLVENEERRIERERARQADALALAAAELVRIALEVRRIEADEPKQLRDARAPRRRDRRAGG